MNFFAQQDQARRKTYQLVALFALAVVGIVVGVNLVLLLALGSQQLEEAGSMTAVVRQNPDLFVVVTVAILGLIAGASAVRMAKLRQGGSKVAEMLGGSRVSADSRDPLERRLLNVVEEMALATGAPVPAVYVLREEAGINAFAAGYSPADAAVAVTRGALETLNRRELQGVIAHEFSHVVNGDMRLNTRLMGVLFGILVLTVVGRFVMYGTRFRGGGGRGGQGAMALMLAALALMVLGYIGLFFGRLIKAGVSRQREYLADASAVQFTREPEGIADALKKIGAAQEGSVLQSPETEEVNHMLFGEGFRAMSGLLASHPPLLQRIQAIEPHFDQEALQRFAEKWQRQQAAAAERAAAREEMEQGPPAHALPGLGGLPGGGAIPAAVVTGILLAEHAAGERDAASPAAARQIAALPEPLYRAVHTAGEAAVAVLYLLLNADAGVREAQIKAVAGTLGEAAVVRLREWWDAGVRAAPEQRLPLLELAVPTMRQRPPEQLQQLDTLIATLVRADRRISVFEYALGTLFRAHMRDVLAPTRARPGGRRGLDASRLAIRDVLAVVARVGAQDEAAAAAAYQAGIAHLELSEPPPYAFPEEWPRALDTALAELDHLKLPHLESLVAALGETVTHNHEVTLEEFELLRALCGALHCPVPPLLQEAAAGED